MVQKYSYKPPVRVGAIFNLEKAQCPCEAGVKQPADPSMHPLFGIPLNHPEWPGMSEYNHQFSWNGGAVSNIHPQQGSIYSDSAHLQHLQHQQQQRDQGSNRTNRKQCLPWPCGPKIHQRHRDNGAEEYLHRPPPKAPQRFDQLYYPTPLPTLDKHFRGHKYHIDDPIGQVITPEEITKCRETQFGPVEVKIQEEMANIFLPNYRYKEWVEQPHYEILKQNDISNSPLCRLPEADTRYYDFYSRDRMHRPTPKLNGPMFGTCRVIPLPADDFSFISRHTMA